MKREPVSAEEMMQLQRRATERIWACHATRPTAKAWRAVRLLLFWWRRGIERNALDLARAALEAGIPWEAKKP